MGRYGLYRVCSHKQVIEVVVSLSDCAPYNWGTVHHHHGCHDAVGEVFPKAQDKASKS